MPPIADLLHATKPRHGLLANVITSIRSFLNINLAFATALGSGIAALLVLLLAGAPQFADALAQLPAHYPCDGCM